MNNSKFFILFAKSQTEGLNPVERRELDMLMASNPQLAKDAEFLSDISSNTKTSIKADGKSVFNSINDEINSLKIIQFKSDSSTHRRSFSIQKVAAVVIILITTGFFAYFLIQKPLLKPAVVIESNAVKIIEKTVTTGQKLKLYLPDGSIVWLNSESKIIYPEKFLSNQRVVELEGEAFFMVEKNPQKPFIVKSGDLNTTAIGTSFNVNNYDSENHTKVTLVTGKVRVELSNNSVDGIILGEGYAVNYSKTNNSIYKLKAEVDKVISWKDGILLFEDDSFETVINTLSRWYGVKFVVNNYDGREWTYSGRFQNDYLSNILESISFIENFDYKIENEKVTLSFKN